MHLKKSVMRIEIGHQYINTTEDEKFIFWINAHTPIEKESNQDWNTTIHLKNNGPHITVPLIFWFLIMTFYLCFITNFELNGSVYILEIDSPNICGCLTLNVMHIKFLSLIICLINGNCTKMSSTHPPEGKKQYCIKQF